MSTLVIAAVCSKELLKRLQAVAPEHRIRDCALGEALAQQASQRPDLFIIEVHQRWSLSDTERTRTLLQTLKRGRSGGQAPRIVLCGTACATLYHVGSLLFESESSLQSSGVIDSLIIQPPLSIAQCPSLEEQFRYTLRYLQGADTRLPCLGEAGWAPSLAAEESLDLWLRWLVRYAGYVSESPLIVGETGSGKTQLARALHILSGRSGPFVSITPRDFSSAELVQAELFGAVAGAYTGAVDKWGLVKKAEGGTLFIDELQSIDVELQGKLITFIEDKKYRRVGAAEQHSADVRFVFASNKPLSELVRKGLLRDDFAYRLERLQLKIAPLRERRLDIAAAIARALAVVQRVRPKPESLVQGISEDAFRLIYMARWPGNLRQLENVIAQAVERCSMRAESILSRTDARAALEDSLGGYETPNENILERSAELVLRDIRSGSIRSCGEASKMLLSLARELALETKPQLSDEDVSLLGVDRTLLELLEEYRR